MSIANADEIVVMPIDWQKADLYRFFAWVFGPPASECFKFMASPSTPKALGELWKCLGCEGDFPEFSWFAAYDLYESAYINLFDVGVPEPPVPLFESAHDKSHPAQETALEATYFYEVLGLKSDPSQAVPDYLITQLEFLAAVSFTLENSVDHADAASLARAKSEFLERHLLNWLPAASRKLNGTGAPGFPVLMEMLLQFLRNEQSRQSFERPLSE
jgi:DMSO reductase family type II enzyme chaperone